MIKHIVLYKLIDNTNHSIIGETITKLKSMVGRVPQILELEVGVDFLKSSRSYDIVLSVLLPNKEALREYQQNQYHHEFVKPFMHSNISSSVAIDYEI